jgi:photosystem II stability/assembly factor-like uncharacterized protein
VGGEGTILRSTDAGVTWSLVMGGALREFRGVWGDGDTVLAVGTRAYGSSEVTILRSADAGATWTEERTGSTYLDLEGVWGDGSTWVAVGNTTDPRNMEGRILTSTDFGATWSVAWQGLRRVSLADVSGEGRGVVAVGSAGTVLRSSDGGTSWTATVGGYAAPFTGVWGSGSDVVAVGYDTYQATNTVFWYHPVISRSTDGGARWTSRTLGPIGPLLAVSGSGSVVVAAGSDCEAERSAWCGPPGVLRSADGAVNWGWAAVSAPMPGRFLLQGIWMADASTGLAVGGSGTILRSADAGASWAVVRTGLEPWLNAVGGAGPLAVAVGDNGRILRSDDSGVNWVPVPSGTGLHLFGVWAADPATLIAVGEDGLILRSADAGLTWTAVRSGGGQTLRDVSGVRSTLVAVGAGGTILRSTDRGASWLPLRSDVDGTLLGIWMADARSVVAVGENGLILRGRP